MRIDPELRALAEAGRWNDLEDLWMEHLEDSPGDIGFFVEAVMALRSGLQDETATLLLQLLLEAQRERGDRAAERELLTAVLRLWPAAPGLRDALLDWVRATYADRPSLDRLMQHFKLAAAPDPLAALEPVETWLRFDVGRAVVMSGRGIGRVCEINLGLGTVRVEFAPERRESLRLGEAQKLLQPLEPGHYLLDKLERPEALRRQAEDDPGGLLQHLFTSMGRGLGQGELRELLAGIVPEERWNTWWKSARTDPRLAHSAGARPLFTWNASGEAAEAALRRDFEAAPPAQQLELARKLAGRSPELAAELARGVARVAEQARVDDPSLALEAVLTLEKLAAAVDPGFDAAALLALHDPVPVVAGVQDRGLRERALALVREQRDDWPQLYARLLRAETDTRTLALLYDTLQRAGGGAALGATVDDVLVRPHTAPRLFVWLCRELRRRPELEARGDWGLLRRLLDALTQEAFRGVRPALREQFDAGGLAEHLSAHLDSDQAEQLLHILQRDLGLEEHRKEILRAVVRRTHAELREVEEEVLYTTPQALDRKRAEFEQIARIDIPRNAEEIRKAAAHGDLRENFEYKAARDRHEMLSSRAKTLHDELRRARALDPAGIDTAQVRVGTCVTLEPLAGGEPRRITILGPWDSDPARGVVSYLAPAVQPLLGCKPGQRVRWSDAEFVVQRIDAWHEV
jgi:transcription elongation GreA/GreB family factor